jgi:hypothetical protein
MSPYTHVLMCRDMISSQEKTGVTIHHFSNLSPNLVLLVQAAMVLKNGNRQGTKGAPVKHLKGPPVSRGRPRKKR